MPALLSDPKRAFGLYLALILGLSLAFTALWQRGLNIETNILALLPPTEQDPVIATAVDDFTASLSSRVIFLVGHDDGHKVREAATSLEQQLNESPLFNQVTGHIDSDQERAWFETYFPYRYQLLSQQTQQKLTEPDGGAWLTAKAEQALYSPMSAVYSRVLDEDPLLLFADFIQGLPKPPGNLKVRNGWLSTYHEEQLFVMITASSNLEAFSRKDQAQAIQLLDELAKAFTEQGLAFKYTGVLRYAAAGADLAEREVSIIGTGSTLGVILLFLLVFRGPRPLFLGLLPIATGLLAATVVCFSVFGSLHLMTFGFGAGLIGISIDYTFHYFCERLNESEAKPKEALQHILPAITLGATTSIMAYLGLMVAPFPGLRQMALFSAIGLLGAFATVILAFPLLAKHKMAGSSIILKPLQHYLKLWEQLPKQFFVVMSLLCLPLLGWGLYKLEALDDIRALQEPDPSLREEEDFIKALAGGIDTSRFLLVEGKDAEEVLRRQEALDPVLKELQSENKLVYFQGVHQFLPSQNRQGENHKRLREQLLDESQALDTYLTDLEFEDNIAQSARTALLTEPSTYLDLETWLKSKASDGPASLWLGATERGQAAVVILGGLTDTDLMAGIAEAHEGVAYVDKVAEISSLMKRYRELSAQLVGLAYVGILLLLLWRHGFKGGFLIVAPAVLAALATLSLFGWLGLPISLFNLLALLLVLGIGIDYTIFLAETKGGQVRTMLAVFLSALTTLMAFGLLALSEVAVLYSFGLTVLFGISIAWVLAPMALRGRS